MIGLFLDWLLGPRCPVKCGERVHPSALKRHLHVEHGGWWS